MAPPRVRATSHSLVAVTPRVETMMLTMMTTTMTKMMMVMVNVTIVVAVRAEWRLRRWQR